MKKFFVFEDTVASHRPAASFFLYCLHRTRRLLRWLPVLLFASFLRLTGIYGEEKYTRKFWAFTKDVPEFDRLLAAFAGKYRKKKKLLRKAEGENVVLVSALPRCFVGALFPDAELYANAFDPAEGSFSGQKTVRELAEDAVSAAGEAFTAVLTPVGRNPFSVPRDQKSRVKKEFVVSGRCFHFRAMAVLYQLMPWVLLAFGAVCLSLVSLYYASITLNYSLGLFKSYFAHPLIPVLNTLPVILTAWFLYLLCNSAAASYAVTSAFYLVISWCNYYKLLFRGDPVVAEDIFIIGEAADMTGVYTITVGKKMILILFLVVVAVAVLARAFRIRIRSGRFRAAGILLAVVLSVFGMKYIYLNPQIYAKTENLDVIHQWSPTEQYNARGFVYPLLYSFTYAFDTTRPDGYSDEKAERILAEYTETGIPEDKQVSIISIQLEAFADFSRFDTLTFTKDPYEYLHRLEEESFYGSLADNIFAGGTVDTERSFITGYASLPTFQAKTMSYLWEFSKAGYSVWGAHPSYQWFYNRLSINRNLGLQTYYYAENTFRALSGSDTAPDSVLFPFILAQFEAETADGTPCFSFNVSYQGHGPYSSTDRAFTEEYCANSDVSEASYTIMNNYLSSLADTQVQLEKLIDALRSYDQPTVVVLYGDHMPWLGNNNSVYGEYGMDINLSTETGFFNYYGTPYLIWANDRAKEVTGREFTGQGETVSPIFLMNLVYQACGYQGSAYMQITSELMECVPVIHSSGFYYTDHTLTTSIPAGNTEAQEALDRYLTVQYYRKHHFE